MQLCYDIPVRRSRRLSGQLGTPDSDRRSAGLHGPSSSRSLHSLDFCHPPRPGRQRLHSTLPPLYPLALLPSIPDPLVGFRQVPGKPSAAVVTGRCVCSPHVPPWTQNLNAASAFQAHTTLSSPLSSVTNCFDEKKTDHCSSRSSGRQPSHV